MDHREYYKQNNTYSNFLEGQEREGFSKYIDYILKYTKGEDRILDVGCGTGIVVESLIQSSRTDVSGVDISSTSIQKCHEKKLNCEVYDGETLPFSSDMFDVIGSINVLEHTNNPTEFLNEQFRVLKKDGYFIIVCPNFLSITNGYHQHTRGIIQKVKNIFSIVGLYFSKRAIFEKMTPIDREDFEPDDDAVNVTNPISILKWSKSKNLKLEYWSSQSAYKKGLINYLDHSFLRVFLGSSFFIFKK